MATINDLKKTFQRKGIDIEIPLDSNLLINRIDCLEKKRGQRGRIELLLEISFINQSGQSESRTLSLTGVRRKERSIKPRADKQAGLSYHPILPLRKSYIFDSDQEVIKHLETAITYLLLREGYVKTTKAYGIELAFKKGKHGFFLLFLLRCTDESAKEEIKRLTELVDKYGTTNDYGLIMPAFQESLGVSLRDQELWVIRNHEFLSKKNIGVYGVDNQNPNRIYPFSIYPHDRGLKSYFIKTFSQWRAVRTRYVEWERSNLG